jgi:hypothetical protein
MFVEQRRAKYIMDGTEDAMKFFGQPQKGDRDE